MRGLLSLALLVSAPLCAQEAPPARQGWVAIDQLPKHSAPSDPHARLLELGRRISQQLPEPWQNLVVPTTGELRLAVVLVEFADRARPEKFPEPRHWEQALFSRGEHRQTATGQPAHGSMADYYRENSGGALAITGKVFDWVKVPTPRAELGTAPLNDGQSLLFRPALDALLAREGATALDGFHALAFVAAGPHTCERVGPEHQDKPGFKHDCKDRNLRRGSTLWPHSAVLLHGGRAWRYYLMSSGLQRFEAIGIHCHELGHVLGILDKYGVGRGTGLGQWCSMADGARGARGGLPLETRRKDTGEVFGGVVLDQLEDGIAWLRDLLERGRRAPPEPEPRKELPTSGEARPLHFCAVCKLRLGWTKPVTVEPGAEPVRFHLRGIEEDPTQVVRIPLDRGGREAIVLEYRRKVGFDAELAREGLLVWRTGSPLAIVRTFVPWEQVELLAAHGQTSIDAPLRDALQVPFPVQGKTELVVKGEWPGARTVTLRGIALEDGRAYVELAPR